MAGVFTARSLSVARAATPAQIEAFLRADGRQVLSFVGYSASGYQDPAGLLAAAAAVLDGHSPASTLVNIGATPQGIGAVYPLAHEKGFVTLGIVSSLARRRRTRLSAHVDRVFYVEDSVWGGLLPGSTRLSPTSATIVANSHVFVAIGGGAIAAAELQAARAGGANVSFIPADMNHRTALRRAARQGLPPPADFRGAAHAVWFGPA